MPGHEMNENTGRWKPEEIRDGVSQLDPQGSDFFLGNVERFRAGVETAIRTRLSVDASDTEMSVFLLAPFKDDRFSSFKRCRLLSHGSEQVGGRVWIVNAVQAGSYIENTFKTYDELFDHLTGELSLGNVPTLVVDPKLGKARFYRQGLNEDDDCDITDLFVSVSLDDILLQIGHIYDDDLLTPEAQTEILKLWEDSGKHWPKEKAEKTIQANLIVGLKAAFRIIDIRTRLQEEQTQGTGRIDLLITQKLAPHRFINIAVLELKVLRSFSSGGTKYTQKETLEWVKDGVEQAFAYRQERDAKESALCCFDMREQDTKDACFDHVKENAAKLEVKLRRWYIYSTSKQWRAELTAKELAKSAEAKA